MSPSSLSTSSWPRTGVVDLTSLPIPARTFARGERLFRTHHVHDNPLYPWLFAVTGDVGRDGSTSLYVVDLESRTCDCNDMRFRGGFCKHLVAGLLRWMEREGEKGQEGWQESQEGHPCR